MKKKLFVYIIIGLLSLGLVGCDKDKDEADDKTKVTTESEEKTTEKPMDKTEDITESEEVTDEDVYVSDTYFTLEDVGYTKESEASYLDEVLSLKFTYEGKEMNLPTSYNEFINGWTFVYPEDEKELDIELEPKEEVVSSKIYKGATGLDIVNSKYDPNLITLINIANKGDEVRKASECEIHSIGMKALDCETYPDFVLPGGITFGSTMEEVFDAYGIYVDTMKVYEYTKHMEYVVTYTMDSREVADELDLDKSNYEWYNRGVCVTFRFDENKELFQMELYGEPEKRYTDRVLLNEYVTLETDISNMSYADIKAYLDTLPETYARKFLITTDNMPEGECQIISYLRDDEIIIIPETINGLKVTSIGNYVFSDCINTKVVKLPNTVTTLGDGVFMNYLGIYAIVGAENVVSAGTCAFSTGISTNDETPEVRTKIALDSYEYTTDDGEIEDDHPFQFACIELYVPSNSKAYDLFYDFNNSIVIDVNVNTY